MRKNLVLLGMMGVGKSTLGKIVAKKLGLAFMDTDLSIEKKLSMKISDIFKKKGEVFFRKEEEIKVSESLKKNNCVIALGGGAFITKNIRDKILKNCISVWLDINLETLIKRTKWNKKRPLINNSKQSAEKVINELYKERRNIYKLANYKINCDNLTKESIVKKIISLYEIS